jgi:DUF4097 and DUF4098 domain-containing protein YvlB
MNYVSLTSLVACVLAVCVGTQNLDNLEKETVRRAFSLSDTSTRKAVEVDNLNGSIEVVGYEGSEVQLLANKTIKADSREKAQEAKRAVTLDISQADNTLRIYVDGPFRCKDGSLNYRGRNHLGYQVNYDFELKVPRETSLCLKTVNEGDIKVQKTTGQYDIENINGGVEMLEVSGAGRVYALNGEVKVLFSKNPPSDCSFGSLNGKVEVLFRPDLSANLRLKTFNGEVYTDFPVSYLPSMTPARESHRGKYVYKSDQFFGVRIGGGGPELKFDAFNGNIHILRREK